MKSGKQCSVPDCLKPVRSRGYCNAHHLRLLRHGTPDGGGVLRDGSALRFAKEVASTCQADECLPWPYTRGAKGYGQVQIDGRHALAHRLVCEIAHGPAPSPKHEATHDCGNPICVNQKHLSWKTHTGNMADKLLHGTSLRGEQHNMSKLTEPQVREIIALRGKMLQREIAGLFDVDPSLISHIYRGKVWSWLTGAAQC